MARKSMNDIMTMGKRGADKIPLGDRNKSGLFAKERIIMIIRTLVIVYAFMFCILTTTHANELIEDAKHSGKETARVVKQACKDIKEGVQQLGGEAKDSIKQIKTNAPSPCTATRRIRHG